VTLSEGDLIVAGTTIGVAFAGAGSIAATERVEAGKGCALGICVVTAGTIATGFAWCIPKREANTRTTVEKTPSTFL
jgi:hypothetical protein